MIQVKVVNAGRQAANIRFQGNNGRTWQVPLTAVPSQKWTLKDRGKNNFKAALLRKSTA
jgi:hypothetical protein